MGVYPPTLPTMTTYIMRVDFYILHHHTITQQDYFLCQLVQKAYLRTHQLYIHTQHQQQAQHIDQLLWTFQDTSFIPHQLFIESEQKFDTILPIQIGYKNKPGGIDDILINLSMEIPPFVNQFKRLIEIVPEDEQSKNIMRQHYRYYRNQNFQLNSHPINKALDHQHELEQYG